MVRHRSDSQSGQEKRPYAASVLSIFCPLRHRDCSITSRRTTGRCSSGGASLVTLSFTRPSPQFAGPSLQFAGPSPPYRAVAGYAYPNRAAGTTKVIKATWRYRISTSRSHRHLPGAGAIGEACTGSRDRRRHRERLPAMILDRGPWLGGCRSLRYAIRIVSGVKSASALRVCSSTSASGAPSAGERTSYPG